MSSENQIQRAPPVRRWARSRRARPPASKAAPATIRTASRKRTAGTGRVRKPRFSSFMSGVVRLSAAAFASRTGGREILARRGTPIARALHNRPKAFLDATRRAGYTFRLDVMMIVGIVPARYASVRFPGKPLAPLAGKPMLLHVV